MNSPTDKRLSNMLPVIFSLLEDPTAQPPHLPQSPPQAQALAGGESGGESGAKGARLTLFLPVNKTGLGLDLEVDSCQSKRSKGGYREGTNPNYCRRWRWKRAHGFRA